MKGEYLLSNITVIELSQDFAAHSCGRILADNGAKVVLIESSPKGCPTRYTESMLKDSFFYYYNVNKKSVLLNFDKDIDILKQLVLNADVFLTDYSKETLESLQLDYESIKLLNQRLVYAQIDGYGEKGPLSGKGTNDVAAYFAETGFLLDMPKIGDYPLSAPRGMGAISTGTTLFGAICASLYKKERSNVGDRIVVSIFGNGIWTNSLVIGMNQPGYGNKMPTSRYKDEVPITNSYLCSDDEWILLAILDLQYEMHKETLFNLLEIDEFVNDPRFKSYVDINEHSKALFFLFEKQFKKKEFRVLDKVFGEKNIVITKLSHFEDLTKNEQVLQNEYLFRHQFRSGQMGFFPRTPLLTDSSQMLPINHAPRLGEQTDEILKLIRDKSVL